MSDDARQTTPRPPVGRETAQTVTPAAGGSPAHESQTTITPLRRWAMVPPSGIICQAWLFARRVDAERTLRMEYPGRGRGARVVRVIIAAEEGNGAR
jgi:hypothetical protein